jgi:hypothetical protein
LLFFFFLTWQYCFLIQSLVSGGKQFPCSHFCHIHFSRLLCISFQGCVSLNLWRFFSFFLVRVI